MTNQRLTELETKVAFAEAAVQELSEVIYTQRQEIDRLNAFCRRLQARMETLHEDDIDDDPGRNVPPHY